ncbi:MAG: SPOR domain-containing protein [Desulfobacterales bacterium]|jgi:hypothetical protein
MKLKTISLIASISLVIFAMGVFGFIEFHNKLLNLRFAHQHKKLESDSQFPIPFSKGTILLLLAVGIINPLGAHHKKKTSRSTSQTKSPQKSDDLKINPSRIPDSMRDLGLGESQIEAFDELRNAVCGDANFIILTGDSGTGKTKLIQCLKKEIAPEYIIFEIDNEFQNAEDLFMLIAAQTGINKNFSSKGAFLIRFDQFLQTVQTESKKILFIVDHFTVRNEKLFEELTFLSNIKIQHQKIIKILISGENISFSPDERHKLKNSSVVICRLKRLNISEQSLRATIFGSIQKYREEFTPRMSDPKYIDRKILRKTEQATALFVNLLSRFRTWKWFDRSIKFAGTTNQYAMDAFSKVLARIRAFVQSATSNLTIKKRHYGHSHFSISGLFDSLLWNSVLSVGLFAVALAFSFWYQGILPFKPDVPESNYFQKKYNSPKVDQENFHGKEIITSSQQFIIKPKKQLGADQNLIDVNRQNKLKPNLQIKRPGPLETNYFVQVGAFRNKENADKIVRKLKLKGYTAETVTLTDSKDRQWHTVRIGEHVSLNAAKKHAADFSNKEKMDSIVLPLKKQ